MEDATKVLRSAVKRPPQVATSACLVHIYPSGPSMGMRYPLEDKALMLGRDDDCQVILSDESVSRRHACIEPDADGYRIMDLNSTNGTYVNQIRVMVHPLKDGDYIHIGNAIYRFLTGGNIESQYHEEIYRLAIIDALTGIHNKRYFMEFLGREISCAVRYRRPLSLVLLDIDRFKSINDRHGHLAGDHTLRDLAACIKNVVRKEDLFARYGGEEFALVLPDTSKEGAVQIAERVRLLVEQTAFEYEGTSYQVTVSLGVESVTGDEWVTTDEVFRQADEKLYLAKHRGRNCVVG